MINQDKWISSLPKMNSNLISKENQLNHDKWINTISKEKAHHSSKKYSLMAILFVFGLVFVSVVKNETRDLQKEINNLEASIQVIKFNLDQAILDNEVITSPENISRLAKEYLNTNFSEYKRSQIKNLNDKSEKFMKISKFEKKETNEKKIKKLSSNVKSQVAKRIEKKRTEIRKLQELYREPEQIPIEIKTQVAKQIKEKKIELKSLYSSPADVLTLERVGRWGVVQVVKVFLGMPIVPGR